MLKRFTATLFSIIVLLLFLAGAVSQDRKIFGHEYDDISLLNKDNSTKGLPNTNDLNKAGFKNVNLIYLEEGIFEIQDKKGNKLADVINSSVFCSDIIGYAGPIPMLIFMDDEQRISQIEVLKNNEDIPFLRRVIKNGIVEQWIGKNHNEIEHLQADAVSGATMSSNAINYSVIRCSEIYTHIDTKDQSTFKMKWDSKHIVLLIILAFAVFASFFHKKSSYIRFILLFLNIGVLGFWCSKFISFNFLIGLIENGIHLENNLIIYLMILLSIVMPLFFKKKSFYCTWVCPFGAAQELTGKITKKKWTIPPKVMRYLKYSRKFITIVMLILMWAGVTTKIVGYEPFSAFMFKNAMLPVLITAACSIILSLFISKPWCRFLCPTGQLLSWTEGFKIRKNKKK